MVGVGRNVGDETCTGAAGDLWGGGAADRFCANTGDRL